MLETYSQKNTNNVKINFLSVLNNVHTLLKEMSKVAGQCKLNWEGTTNSSYNIFKNTRLNKMETDRSSFDRT